MSQEVFQIKDLYCAYDRNPGNAVLYVENLKIQKGELVFLLGASGSGKSTLLETLGLMNNTIASGQVLFYAADQRAVDFNSLWKPENLDQSARIRKSNFSFIFQNTNLMENFTAYENVCLSKMIQQHTGQQEAMAGAHKLMDKVGLPVNQVPETALSVNLSGGQRQRVAFVRALNSDCTVLFGDEPTGNLDEGNANELMNVVKAYLQEKGLTAIIVSHDINLAINHASKIVCLTRHPSKNYGEILPQNIYDRSHWQNKNADEINEFRSSIRAFYTQNPYAKTVANDTAKPAELSKNYKSLFLKKEGKALYGRGFTNLSVLTMLLTFTFLAIGFANGSLAYLKEKIENPFVNWLTVDIPAHKGSRSEVNNMVRTLNEASTKSNFYIKSANSFTERPLSFYKAVDTIFTPVRSRSVQISRNYTDPVVTDLLAKENRLRGTEPFKDAEDLSVIVTKRFMEDNGYSLDAPFIYFENHEYDSTQKKVQCVVPLGVRAVVKQMPGKAQVIFTDYFDRANQQVLNNAFDLRRKRDFLLYLATNKTEAIEIRKKVIAYLKTSTWSKTHEFDVETPNESHTTYYTGYDMMVTPTPPLPYNQWRNLYHDIKTVIPKSIVNGYYFNYYDFDKDFNQELQSDKLSINFYKLDKVPDFAQYVLHQFNDEDEIKSGSIMEVDFAKVKEKENFNFLSNLTGIISYILIVFGVISVSLFIFNLLKMHLSKVKMNIGTFKAFGLSDREAQGVYFNIILRFLIVSLVLSLLLAAAFGYLLNLVLVNVFIIESGVSYFKLLALFTYVTLGLMFASALTVSWFTIRSMLSKTPGDLIYNR